MADISNTPALKPVVYTRLGVELVRNQVHRDAASLRVPESQTMLLKIMFLTESPFISFAHGHTKNVDGTFCVALCTEY